MGYPDRRKSRKRQTASALSIGSFALLRSEPKERKESYVPPPPDDLVEEKPEEPPIPLPENAAEEEPPVPPPPPPPPPPPETQDMAPREAERPFDDGFQEDAIREGIDGNPDAPAESSEVSAPGTRDETSDAGLDDRAPQTQQGSAIPEEIPEPEPEDDSSAAIDDGEKSATTAKKPVVSRGETFNMCPICMGIIKHGLAMMVCNCRKVYHVSCGKRLVHCPNCESRFSDDMITGKDEEPDEIRVDYESHEVPKLQLTPEDKLELLEERLILGEVSEEVYRELKNKYENELELGTEPKGDRLYRCPSCGKMVDEDAERCSCGAVFSGEVGFLCPECGRVVPHDSNACKHCGIRFSEASDFSCPSCGRRLIRGTAVCPCGTKFLDALVEGFNCPECGKFLESDASVCDNCGVSFEDND